MSNSETENNSKFQKLTGKNYHVWAIQKRSQLMTANAWRIVTGELKQSSDPKQLEIWLSKREEAAGIIMRSLSPNQYIHIENKMDNPIAMWDNLKNAHQSQGANGCYHAIQRLLTTRKEDAEMLTEYISRIITATNDLVALAPSTLTAKDALDEGGMHAAIRGLNHEDYGAFTSSILLLGKLN